MICNFSVVLVVVIVIGVAAFAAPRKVIFSFEHVWKLMKLETIFDEFTERKLHVIVINIIMHTFNISIFFCCFNFWYAKKKHHHLHCGNGGLRLLGVCVDDDDSVVAAADLRNILISHLWEKTMRQHNLRISSTWCWIKSLAWKRPPER